MNEAIQLARQTVFIDCKYSRWYFSIVERAQLEQRKKLHKADPLYTYYEGHHILPKADCMFPEHKRASWNVVLLTPKEHFVCHLLLPRMCAVKRHRHSMNMAIRAMARVGPEHGYRYTSAIYEREKRRISREGVFTEKQKALMSQKRKGVKKPEGFGAKIAEINRRRIFTEESREKMRCAKAGKSLTEEHRLKIGKAGLGRQFSEESRQKISDAKKAYWSNLSRPNGSL